MLLIITVLSSIFVASIIEGLLHQFVLHTAQRKALFGVLYSAFRAHAIEHHPAYRDKNYHRPAPADEKRISLEWYTLPLVLIVTSPLTWLAWKYFGIVCGIAVPVTLSGYYFLYETLHWLMHFPLKSGRPRWFQRIAPIRWYFEWFNKRHFIHHLVDDRNFNVVFPIYDWLTGRYTTSESRIPWAIRIRKKRNLAKAEAIRRSLGRQN